jgi:hypothetical protein
MKRFKMPPQVVRLVILTLGIVASYAIARQIFIPKSFGQYGHWRGDALMDIAARQPQYAGQKSCEECHSDEFKKILKFEHKTVSCESCHGVSRAHGDDPDHVNPIKLTDHKTIRREQADAFCLRCHNFDPGRPAWLKQIEISKHYAGKERCVECHMPHQPNEVP